MPDRFQESHIRRVPLFQTLPQPQFELAARAFQVQRFKPGEIIFYQGYPTRGLQIIVEGQGVLLQTFPNGSQQQVGTLAEGQYINQNALFQTGTETATLQAITPVTILLLAREEIASLLAYHPELGQSWGLAGRRDQYLHAVQFKTQRENEEVLLKTRRHWFAYIRWMWVPVLLMIPFWALTAAFTALAPVLIPLSLILPGIAAAYLYFEWANDSVIITDQRVVRITHTILTFSEIRDEVALESIQEANAAIPALNPFAVLLRYGNVELKTAGSAGNFLLDFMPRPHDLQQLIMENRSAPGAARQREVMRAEVERWISGGQPFAPSPTARKSPAENKQIWKVGEGPASPFISQYMTQDGGLVYRKHWLIWMRNIMLPAMWLVATASFMILLLTVGVLQAFGVIGWALAIVLLLVGVVWFYFVDWDWRNDYYVVTDSNIVIINRRPLWLQSENDQVMLRQVDNVVAETHGISQRVFGYGDVKVSLVGADEAKVFRNVANPLDVQGEISRRQLRMKQRSEQENSDRQREMIGEYISMYHETVGQGDAPPPEPLRDRSRPPLVPRQRPPRPTMSAGRPYQPNTPAQPGPPSVPQQTTYSDPARPSPYGTPTNPPPNPPLPPRERDTGRPPKFPRRRPDS